MNPATAPTLSTALVWTDMMHLKDIQYKLWINKNKNLNANTVISTNLNEIDRCVLVLSSRHEWWPPYWKIHLTLPCFRCIFRRQKKKANCDYLATGNLREGKQFSNFVCSRFAGTGLSSFSAILVVQSKIK